MWKHMARIVGEVRPRYVYVENSPMLTSRGLGTILGNLAEMGFDAEWGVLEAADVGAPHQRDRIWIVAHSNSAQRYRKGLSVRVQQEHANSHGSSSDGSLDNSNVQRLEGTDNHGEISQWFQPEFGKRCEEVSNTSSQRQQGQGQPVQRSSSAQNGEGETNLFKPICVGEFWRVEPNVGRVADGVAARVDRLKAIGNGQVSAVAATAWTILNEKRTAQKSSSVPRNAQVSEQKE
jgi:DNA (cytosine-5)-methyltransferase 1